MRYLPWYAFSLPTKRRRPFGEKHAAFYPKARLLFEKAGGLLKFAARAFFKSWRPFRFALPRGYFWAIKHYLTQHDECKLKSAKDCIGSSCCEIQIRINKCFIGSGCFDY
ncbi:MAG: hypothetical protein KBT57_00120 [bacterium]|nr:hypothetical protein [Candidatus Limimorpha equi]